MEVLWTWERMLEKTKLEWRRDMPELSENFMPKEQYIEEGGTRCINCGKGNLRAGIFEEDSAQAWRDIVCIDCGYDWIEVFTLTDVEAIDD